MIAVLDSGVGGTSVLRELLKLLPGEDFLYYGDMKNAPYGTKQAEEVRNIVSDLVAKFVSDGAKAIVIACNTATAVAAEFLRERYPTLPIIGIEPALKPASLVCEHPHVLVMATPLTLAMPKYGALEARFAEKARIDNLPCPGLMEMIEQGHLEDQDLKVFLSGLFQPIKGETYDACVLGCTHYPHVKKMIASFVGPSCEILDGGAGTARELKRRLELQGLLSPKTSGGKIVFENSLGSEQKNEFMQFLTFKENR